MCQIIWTPPPTLFNGTRNICACSCMEACNVERCLTWTWHGESLCPGHNVRFAITLLPLISWRENKWLYFHLKKAVFGLFVFIIPVSPWLTCVVYACFRMCKQHPPNATSVWLTVTCFSTSANRDNLCNWRERFLEVTVRYAHDASILFAVTNALVYPIYH